MKPNSSLVGWNAGGVSCVRWIVVFRCVMRGGGGRGCGQTAPVCVCVLGGEDSSSFRDIGGRVWGGGWVLGVTGCGVEVGCGEWWVGMIVGVVRGGGVCVG